MLNYFHCDIKEGLLKNSIFRKKPKLNFYHRKMHRSFLFQNVCGFLQNDQILINLLRKLGPLSCPSKNVSSFLNNFSVLGRLPFHLHQHWKHVFSINHIKITNTWRLSPKSMLREKLDFEMYTCSNRSCNELLTFIIFSVKRTKLVFSSDQLFQEVL